MRLVSVGQVSAATHRAGRAFMSEVVGVGGDSQGFPQGEAFSVRVTRVPTRRSVPTQVRAQRVAATYNVGLTINAGLYTFRPDGGGGGGSRVDVEEGSPQARAARALARQTLLGTFTGGGGGGFTGGGSSR